MTLFLNVVVLIFEILYYSLFIKFARKEGNFVRYLIAFSIITIIGIIIGTNGLISYFALVMMILLAMKYIIGLKTTLYDMFVIVCMLFIKIIIETPLYIVLYTFINNYIIGVIVGIIKLILLILIRNYIRNFYNSVKIKWDKNDFYIRYLFSICCFIYCIITAILLIGYVIK